MIARLSIVAVTCLLFAVAAAPPRAVADEATKWKAGQEVEMAVPGAGNSWGSDGKEPVEMYVKMPDNYDPQREHPVIVVLPNAEGKVVDRYPKRFAEVLDNKNFIFVGVSYSNEGERASGPANAVRALKVVMEHASVDKEAMVLAGASTGSYAITDKLGSRETSPYAAYVLVIGGVPFNPRVVGRKPVLLVAGKMDDVEEEGSPRIEHIAKMYNGLKRSGRDVSLVLQKTVAHAWGEYADEDVKKWFYEKFPPFMPSYKMAQRAEKLKGPAKLRVQKQMAERWWYDLPWLNEAREAVAAETK